MRIALYSVLSLVLTACAPQYGVEVKEGSLAESVADAPPAPADEPEEDLSAYEGAVIRIVSPASGDFVPYGEPYPFEAVVTNPAGEALSVDGIAWTSDEDPEWAVTGPTPEDDSIDVGVHNITAEVERPDGARIAHTIGGVLVQAETAGTYVGDMILSLDASFGETPVGASCVGAAVVVIDTYGEALTGSSECTLDLLGYASFDVTHAFEYAVTEDGLSGAARVAIPFLGELPFSSEGTIDDETITTVWEGGFGESFQLDGVLEVTRLTRDITEM